VAHKMGYIVGANSQFLFSYNSPPVENRVNYNLSYINRLGKRCYDKLITW
jgi:hypothetical protein